MRLQAGQRRAQLVGGVGNKAALLRYLAVHLGQQHIDGGGQRPYFVGRVVHFDGGQITGAAVFYPPPQAAQRRQATADAGPHQHAGQQHHAQQRQAHVDQDLARQLGVQRPAFGHLHQHQLRPLGGAGHQVLGGDAYFLAFHARVVEKTVTSLGRGAGRRARHGRLAQQEGFRWRTHHVVNAIVRVLLQDVAGGAGEIDIKAIAERFDLACQRAAGLGQRAVDDLVGVGQRHVVGQKSGGQPQHQLR